MLRARAVGSGPGGAGGAAWPLWRPPWISWVRAVGSGSWMELNVSSLDTWPKGIRRSIAALAASSDAPSAGGGLWPWWSWRRGMAALAASLDILGAGGGFRLLDGAECVQSGHIAERNTPQHSRSGGLLGCSERKRRAPAPAELAARHGRSGGFLDALGTGGGLCLPVELSARRGRPGGFLEALGAGGGPGPRWSWRRVMAALAASLDILGAGGGFRLLDGAECVQSGHIAERNTPQHSRSGGLLGCSERKRRAPAPAELAARHGRSGGFLDALGTGGGLCLPVELSARRGRPGGFLEALGAGGGPGPRWSWRRVMAALAAFWRPWARAAGSGLPVGAEDAA